AQRRESRGGTGSSPCGYNGARFDFRRVLPLLPRRFQIAPFPNRAWPYFTVRIVTLNVNGIRAAEKKGLSRWLKRVEPWDIVCLQEIKATADDVPRALLAPGKSHGFFLSAGRKGYAGVALSATLDTKVT